MAAYGTDAGYKAYADERGISYAGKTDEQIAEARLRASEYVDLTYISLFQGLKVGGRDQERQWPRVGATDMDGYSVGETVPVEIENATYEGAVRELASAGSLNPDIEAGGGQLKREKIGPLEFEYIRDGSTTSTFRRIEDILAPLLGRTSRYFGAAARA